jgi:hypothetical protein
MKLFLSLVSAIFALFLGACVVGYFLPDNLTIERSVSMQAHSDDVYFYLEDLEQYRNWSALDAKLAETPIITGGADMGVGQNQAWQNGPVGYEFGSREIIQTQIGEFVVLNVNIAGQDISTTHAVLKNDGGNVTVLSKIELPQPGFPYLGRLRALSTKADYEKALDSALARLKVQAEADTGFE